MKKRSLAVFVSVMICTVFIAGCGGDAQTPAQADGAGTEQEEVSLVNTEESTEAAADESDTPAPAAAQLSKEECAKEADKLLATSPVLPDNAEILRTMTDCATCSGAVDKAGVIFSEMDNNSKARLRYRFLESATWDNSDIYEKIAKELDQDRWGVPLEDAKKLFLDAYGDGGFEQGEYEQVEDGYIVIQYADGDPVDLVTEVLYYEDEGYILLSGPMFYESNGEGELFEGCADVLFAKNEDSRYGATLLYARVRDVNIRISSVETSSELPASGGKSYTGRNLIDGDPATVWAEGAAGTGVGETITLHLDKKQPVYGIQMITGYTAGYDQYSNNGMPTDIEVDLGGGKIAEGHELEGYGSEGLSPQDLAAMNRFKVGLDEPAVTDTIKITITGAKKGSKYDDTCISEIWVYGPGDASGKAEETSGLTDEDAAEIADDLGGMVCAIENHDYDGDGTYEAYVVTGEYDDYGGYIPEAIWFIASDGKATEMDTKFDFDMSMYSDESGYYVEYADENRGFFTAEFGGYGSGWLNLLFGVRDGKPYELDLSTKIEGFYQDEPGVFYTLTDDFTDGHKYMITELEYDSSTGQFIKGRVTDRNWAI